jgi:hypothetical protein
VELQAQCYVEKQSRLQIGYGAEGGVKNHKKGDYAGKSLVGKNLGNWRSRGMACYGHCWYWNGEELVDRG